jgi:hypothetical protein
MPRVLLMMLVRALDEGQSLFGGVELRDQRVSNEYWRSGVEGDSSRSRVGNPGQLSGSVIGLMRRYSMSVHCVLQYS